MVTEIANEAIALTHGKSISVVSNFYFSAASLLLMCLVATVITERMIEPRLGPYDPAQLGSTQGGDETLDEAAAAAEARGLRFALYGFLGLLAIVLIATLPPGAPLRDPKTGDIIGNTPLMDSLLFIIAMFFLVAGICYGRGAGTVKSSNDVIAAITKTFNTLGGLSSSCSGTRWGFPLVQGMGCTARRCLQRLGVVTPPRRNREK
jgi:aminobenzoyl-glutamate transport protein